MTLREGPSRELELSCPEVRSKKDTPDSDQLRFLVMCEDGGNDSFVT